jgi:hypothetical protein
MGQGTRKHRPRNQKQETRNNEKLRDLEAIQGTNVKRGTEEKREWSREKEEITITKNIREVTEESSSSNVVLLATKFVF